MKKKDLELGMGKLMGSESGARVKLEPNDSMRTPFP
jgi:hypothetical protein